MRPLRVLLFANDGLGAGHVARALAIARALRRKVDLVELLLATTSEAHALLAAEPIAAVGWPAPWKARRSGWSDELRRDVAARVVGASIRGFRPHLLVTDTFPSGPHGELAGLVRRVPRRALIRRSVRPKCAAETPAAAGLADYDMAIVPGDPGGDDCAEALPMPIARVPPITLFEANEGMPRDEARARLGLTKDARVILVCSGGGGDADAAAQAARAAEAIARMPGETVPALAVGPLGQSRATPAGIRRVEATPLQPWLAAFDGAIAPAGYNLAHELAKAGVPLALFAMPRPFDDQAARAVRFERAGIARALIRVDESSVAAAVQWMEQAPRPRVAAGGADCAADALLKLVSTGSA